jgi:hypothetical protein
MNVPPPNDTKLTFWLRKTKWVAIAIFAPELVVYTAFEQWFLAKQFMKAINEAAAKSKMEKNRFVGFIPNRIFGLLIALKTLPPEDRDPLSKPPFDMVYAHYAVMGGFAADVANLHNTLQRVTLTTRGILFLAKHGRFLDTSRSNIQDKSKADTLAKGLVCFQVLWIVGQAIERKVAGYPITLLEVHTIVHVVCAVVMYGLWIRKPLNVQDPTVIDFRERLDILAFMLQTSSLAEHNLGGFECKCINGDKFNSDPTFLWYTNPQPVSSEVKDTPNEVFSAPDTSTVDDNRVLTKYDMKTDIVEEYTPRHNSKIVCKLISGQALSCGLGPDMTFKAIYTPDGFLPQDMICAVSLSQTDINRLELTAKFITRIVELAKLDNPSYTPATKSWSDAVPTSFYQQTSDLAQFSNFPAPSQYAWGLLTLRAPNFGGSVLNNISTATAMALIPTAYGCVHLGALSIIFPTPVERLLWKVSCYYLIATAGASALFSLIIYGDRLIYMVCQPHIKNTAISVCRSWPRTIMRCEGRGAEMVDIVLYVILASVGLILFLYFSARLYIVIESFIHYGMFQLGSIKPLR